MMAGLGKGGMIRGSVKVKLRGRVRDGGEGKILSGVSR
jgi:hypothetical protein